MIWRAPFFRTSRSRVGHEEYALSTVDSRGSYVRRQSMGHYRSSAKRYIWPRMVGFEIRSEVTVVNSILEWRWADRFKITDAARVLRNELER